MEKILTQILLIEDNYADILLLREALEQDALVSFQVTTTDRLKTGLNFLQENDFDAILLDLGLPDSQGLDTFIRLHKESPDIPIIILSGLTDEDLALQAIQFGAQDYLVKRQESWETAARTIRYAMERQRSQIALRESENRFRALFEHSPVAYQALDSDGKFVDFNTQLCELLGYEPYELIGESFDEFWSSETRATFPRKFDRFKRDGKMEADLQLVKKDGTVIEVLLQGKIQYDLHGDITRTHCILHDITARKIAEQALRETQERFSTVFRSNPLGISITEAADGMIIDANEAFLNMFGYTRAEILRHTTLELNMWQDLEDRERTVKKLRRQGEVTNAELKFRRKTGEIINALASHRLIELNGKQCMLNMLNDITDRKQTEQALNDNEKRFNALLENGLDNISLLSADGALVWESPATIRTLDYKPDEFVGRNIFELLHPDDQERILDQFADLVQKPGSRERDSFRLRHADGSWRWVEAVVTNLLNEPSVNAMVVNYHDITGRKQAEEKVHDGEEQLRGIFENATIGIFQSTPEGRFLKVNPTMAKIYGYASPDEMLASITDIASQIYVNPSDRENFIRPLIEKGEIHDFISENLQRDGGQIWTQSSARTVKDGSGKLLYYEGFIREITDRKQTQTEIEKYTEDLALINSLNEAVNRGESLSQILKLLVTECRRIFHARDTGFYMLSPDRKNLILEQFTMPEALRSKIETLAGLSLSGIRIPISPNSHYYSLEKARDGSITNDPEEIQAWVDEFLQSASLPGILSPTIQKLGRMLVGILRVGSVLSIPFHVEQKSIGLLQLTSTHNFTETDLRRLKNIRGQVAAIILHKQAAEALQSSEIRWQTLMQNLPAFIVEAEPDGTILVLNQVQPGFSLDDYIGHSLFDVVAPDSRQQFRQAFAKVLEEATMVEYEAPGYGPNQEPAWYHRQLVPIIEHDKVRSVLMVARDITKRKQAEEKLRISESNYRTLVKKSIQGISIYQEQKMVYANPAQCKIFGYTDEELLAMSAEQLIALTHPDDRSISRERARKRMAGEPVSPSYVELRILRKDGTTGWIQAFNDQIEYDGQPAILSTNIDITERKQAEQALAESESLYRQAIEVAGAVPYYESYYDKGQRIKYEFIGEGIRNITGYGPEEFTAALWDSLVLDIHLVKDLSGYALEEAIQRVRSGENPVWTCEHRIRHRNGEIRWVFEAAVEVLDEHGVSRGSIGMYQDITERKQVEWALRRGEERYRGIFEGVQDAILVESLDGRILDINQRACEMFGYSREQFLTKKALDLVPVGRQPIANYESGLQAISQQPIETIDVRANGEEFPVEISGRLYDFEDEKVFLVVLRDITKRKQAQEALLVEQQRIQKYLDVAEVIMLALDQNGMVTLVNQKACEILGYPYNEVIGKDWLNTFLPSAIRDELKEVFQGFIAGNDEALGYYENPILTRSGEERLIAWHNILIKDNNGAIISTFSSGEDITERKQAEKALRASEQRYRTLIDQTPAVVYIDDSSTNPGRTQFISPYIQTMLGFMPDEWIQGGEELWKDRLYPQDRERVLAEYKRSIQNDEPLDLEYRLFAKDERVVWVHDQAATLRDSAGKPHSVHGVMYDITERKQIEVRLAEDANLLRTLINNIPDRIYVKDAKGRKTISNIADWQASGGKRMEDVIGKSDFEIYPAELAAKFWTNDKAVLDLGVPILNIEEPALDTHGNPNWIMTTKVPLRDGMGQIIGLVGIGRDITERKRLESERQALIGIMQGAISTNDLGQYLNLVHHSVSSVIQAENFFVILHHKDTGLFEEIYSVDQYDEPQPPSKLEKSISAYVFRSGKPLLLTQALFQELASSGEVELVGRNSLSWLGIPLITSMETIGVMVVQDYENADRYSETDQDFLVSIAGQVALAVQRKQTEAEVNHQLSELEALYENGLAISRMLEPKQIANRIVQVLNQKMNWHHAAVRILHPESGRLELLALSQPGLDEAQINEQIERLNQFIINQEYGLSGWVIKHRTAIRSGNLKENPNYVETYPGIQSGLYVPIRSGEEIIGSIAVESEQENAFAERDERLLITLANQAAISFVNARLYLRLQHELGERSYTEEKIRKLNTELEQRVQERTLEIETTHQRLELATASSGIGVWELKSGRDTFYWDERMHGIYGTAPDHFNPTLSDWLNFIHPDDRQAEAEKRKLAITQAGSYESEYRVMRTDGSMHYINSHAVVLVDEARNFKNMIGVNMDITTIKQAEETLRMANNELERALRVKDEFLANMSHELRTPLNAILGLSESLEEQIAGLLNEKQQKYVRTISESGHHLLTLINDILDLAKIEAGQITLEINKMDVHAVCQSSLRMIKQLAQKKNQHIELDIDDHIDLIWADERRLKQMIVNLLSNAVKFTPEGGKIGLEVEADKSDNQLVITVWDSGIGIKDSDLMRLFQPFVQLDSSLSRESAGTGLGLALVAQMARLHGGSVSVTSQPDVGSRFTITLPWEPALAVDTMSRMKITGKFRALKPGTENNRRTILLVEDTEEVVMMVRDYLESATYKVVTATNGMDGITQAKKIRPDLILMDVQMPGMDGLEATQILRREPDFQHTPIIALTALAMSNDRERCLAAGMDEYISKPVNLKALVKIIQSFLATNEESQPS